MTGRSGTLWLRAAAAVAIGFGILTVISGGSVALFDGPAREAAGDYVPFIVWFNLIAGIAYVVAGVGIALRQRWALGLAVAIAVATALVFAAFGVHVLLGGAYEMRTVGAMTLRTFVWIAIVLAVCNAMPRSETST